MKKMKDYSEYIGDNYGFIISIKPNLKSQTIEVMTSASKKNQPHVYTLTRENLQKLYGRLEKQYILLIENKDLILKSMELDKEDKYKRKDAICLGVSGILLLIASIASGLDFLFIVGLIPGVGSITSTIISKIKFKKDFESMIDTYNYYINNKEEIEEMYQNDVNVSKYLTKKSYEELNRSNELVEANVTDNKYTIGLIDSMSLKDLKEMLLRYKISQSLDAEPYVYIDERVIETVPNEEYYQEFFVHDEYAESYGDEDELLDEEKKSAFDEEYDLPELDDNDQVKEQNYSKKLHK